MQVSNTLLTDVLLLEPDVFGDNRGFFMETYNANRYAEAGIAEPFVQDNLSYSSYGVLRGLHLQNPNSQGKLVYVLQGSVFDVAVDVRRNSDNGSEHCFRMKTNASYTFQAVSRTASA